MPPESFDVQDGPDQDGKVIPISGHNVAESLGNMSDILLRIENKFEAKNLPQEMEKERESTRGKITSRIIWMYVACVAAIMAAGVLKLLMLTNAAEFEPTIGYLRALSDYLHVLVLPIITLVLGFYFGSEKK